jgi:hypothetical protein
MVVPGGSVAAPGLITTEGSAASGLYSDAADTIKIAIAGAEGFEVSAAGVKLGATSPVIAQTDNTKQLVSTDWLKTGLAASLSIGGYLKLPAWLCDGTHQFILQWAKGTTDPSGTSEPTQTINWPIAFPTVCMHAQCSVAIAAASTVADMWYQIVGDPTTTGVLVQRQQPSTNNNQPTWPLVFGIGY